MNGRCETDPFDQAIDVCQSCYGEFCGNCLVEVKGRRHPMCTDCTVAASGVRAGVRPRPRGDRKTAKKRRKHLRSQPVQDGFRYFDQTEPRPEPEPEADQVQPGPLPTPEFIAAPEPSGAEVAVEPAVEFDQPIDAASADTGPPTYPEPPADTGPPVERAQMAKLAVLGIVAAAPADQASLAETGPTARGEKQAIPVPSLDVDPFAGASTDDPPAWTTRKPVPESDEQPAPESPLAEDAFHSP
jgi:hypothetical protein